MKMTLVVDTEDEKGIQAALAMVRLMNQKYSSEAFSSSQKMHFHRIALIKFVREFAKHIGDRVQTDPDFSIEDGDASSLRFCKTWVDAHWIPAP